MEEIKKRNSFTGSIGFVLAAAGSAVGLGNIWRFPTLAAKNGGGLFLLIYIILALTFGFTLLITEVAIGRKTQESPLTAYSKLHKGFGFIGVFAYVVPFIIYPYYCVIGGWVIKYMSTYLAFQGQAAVADGFFGGFITHQWQPILYTVLFAAMCFIIVYKGVEHGIERYSKFLMPILAILVIFIAIYSMFLRFTDPATGATRTGFQGLGIYFIPNLEGITFGRFLRICLDAMGQLFYSLSIAMGIMVAYGSYMKKDVNLGKSINQIEIFDSGIAVIAGMMIIPAVFVFAGPEALTSAGPSLIFVTLPKVFDSMGNFGQIFGLLFFVMVLFAALTSAVSILEAIVSSMMDKLKWSRKKATLVMAGVGFIISVIVCLGYNIWYFEKDFATVKGGQILDFLDYASNNLLMPIVAILTCILVGWVVKPKSIIDEITLNGETFKRKGLYIVMIKFVAPILLILIFLGSFGVFDKI